MTREQRQRLIQADRIDCGDNIIRLPKLPMEPVAVDFSREHYTVKHDDAGPVETDFAPPTSLDDDKIPPLPLWALVMYIASVFVMSILISGAVIYTARQMAMLP